MANLSNESALLNRVLADITQLKTRVSKLEKQVKILNGQVNQSSSTAQLQLENNIIFTWTGPTLKISWAAGYIKDKNGIPYPVVAGSRVLVATTVYWAAWNPPQQAMSFATNLADLQSNPANLIICSFRTGDAATTAAAGGGGTTDTGSDFTGADFRLI